MSAHGFTRRRFLSGAGSLSLGTLAPALAPVERSVREGRRLVVLQLFGGNDGLNTLVPIEDDDYHRARPTLRIERGTALPLDELNGLHPSLRRLQRHALEGRVAFVQRVGSPEPNLSHFKSQDLWDAGLPDGRSPTTGWLGRFHDETEVGTAGDTAIGMLAVGFDTLPFALSSSSFVAPALHDLGAYRLRPPRLADERARARQLDVLRELARTPSADERLGYVARAHAAMERSIEELARAARPEEHADYPPTRLGRDLRTVARVIAGGLATRVFVVRQPGYDTHANQARRHEGLLDELDGALDAFLADLERSGELERTLVVTTSEFGRRVAESGNAGATGTDHGAASVALLAGGTCVGGVHGGQPPLDALDAAGNLRYAIDYRSLYATVIERWFGVASESVLQRRWPLLEVLG